jgi:hypothetical protein
MTGVKKLRCLFLKFFNNYKNGGYSVKLLALSEELSINPHGCYIEINFLCYSQNKQRFP